eukprot:TRINITY_DN5681_c0_g1_i7.p1 TRINITY_DN5681_c0_g1~~TRINITY_DN5681_c0_g1_i7.p1  ORF type:complete len:143 (+),score=23.63 TRINITY_DN5681_c0_g1_i7:652-1080(+)
MVVFVLLTYNYSYIEDSSKMNMNIDNSVIIIFFITLLLGTRLQSELQVFVLFLLTTLGFIFFPMLRKTIRSFSMRGHIYTLVGFKLLVFLTLYKLSRFLALFFFVGLLFVDILCPVWIMWLYQYKNVIKGPWDLPKVKSYAE